MAKKPCEHLMVVRNESPSGPFWACANDSCGDMFISIDALARVEQENDRMLDMVTGVFSATLWDLHERAFEAHGIPHDKQDPLTAEVCGEKGHDRDEGTGVCKRCGDSPFLGQ